MRCRTMGRMIDSARAFCESYIAPHLFLFLSILLLYCFWLIQMSAKIFCVTQLIVINDVTKQGLTYVVLPRRITNPSRYGPSWADSQQWEISDLHFYSFIRPSCCSSMIPRRCRSIEFLLLLVFVASRRTVIGFAFVVPLSLSDQRRIRWIRIPHFASSEAIPDLETISSNAMRLVSGLRHTVDHYDVYLLDMWGVLHDGSRPYDHVLEAIQELKRNGKTLMILSNSSKRYDNSVRSLQKLGFQVADFTKIITSGEVTHEMLRSSESSSWAPLQSISSKRVFIFGSGDEDIPYCVSCGWTPVYEIEQADLLLARGPFTVPTRAGGFLDRRTIGGETEYQKALSELLAHAAQRRLPMIVSNPDKVRPDQDRSPMPGQIGDAYERCLQQRHPESATSQLVKRIGKPFPDVYQVALQDMTGDMSRVCMVGDALETDVVGGTRVGIDTIWVVKNGVHCMDVEDVNNSMDFSAASNQVLQTFSANTTGTYAEGLVLQPTVVMPYFQW